MHTQSSGPPARGADPADRALQSSGSVGSPPKHSGPVDPSTVPIRPAVSVIIVRDGSLGPEVFVQHRVQTMDFAAGAVVFPGGRVDPIDYATAQSWGQTITRPEAWSAGDMATTDHHAHVLAATAVREVAEETGARLHPERIMPWANWITPMGPPKRFDTYFFVTPADNVGELRNTTTEAKRSEWLPVTSLLERGALPRNDEHALHVMRPTRHLLEEMLALGTASGVMSASLTRAIVPVRNDRPQN